MRRTFTLLVSLFCTVAMFSQAPLKMSYQAVVRNSGGVLVANTLVGMEINIRQGSTSGTIVYTETQTPTTNDNGLVSIEIGGGAGFSSISWATDTYYIETKTAIAAPLTTYTITGTSQLLSVPYALYTNTALTSTDAVKLTGDQSIAGTKTFTGTINASNKIISSVATPVSTTDAANKAYVDNMLSIIQTIQTGVRDVDGNTYKVILIGNQLWMSENLKTTKYNDGTAIPNITLDATWAALTTGAYSDYNNTPSNSDTYGRLYNWFAVDNNASTKVASNGGKNVCPTGWHVPTDAEWTTLTDYLIANGYNWDGTTTGNKIAKSIAATSGWTVYGTLGTVGNDPASNNSSGFTALPGGYRISSGAYGSVSLLGGWWSSTEFPSANAYFRYITYGFSYVNNENYSKLFGFSVRCLKDN